MSFFSLVVIAVHSLTIIEIGDQVPPKALQTLKQKLGTKRASKRDLARASLDLAVTREHIESILSWFTDINVHLDHPEALQVCSAVLKAHYLAQTDTV